MNSMINKKHSLLEDASINLVSTLSRNGLPKGAILNLGSPYQLSKLAQKIGINTSLFTAAEKVKSGKDFIFPKVDMLHLSQESNTHLINERVEIYKEKVGGASLYDILMEIDKHNSPNRIYKSIASLKSLFISYQAHEYDLTNTTSPNKSALSTDSVEELQRIKREIERKDTLIEDYYNVYLVTTLLLLRKYIVTIDYNDNSIEIGLLLKDLGDVEDFVSSGVEYIHIYNPLNIGSHFTNAIQDETRIFHNSGVCSPEEERKGELCLEDEPTKRDLEAWSHQFDVLDICAFNGKNVLFTRNYIDYSLDLAKKYMVYGADLFLQNPFKPEINRPGSLFGIEETPVDIMKPFF